MSIFKSSFSKNEEELRLRVSLMQDALNVRNEFFHLNDLIANPYLIRKKPVLNFTREKLEKLKMLEDKYNQNSQIDFERLEEMVSQNEELIKKTDKLYKQCVGLDEIIDRFHKGRISKGTNDHSNQGTKKATRETQSRSR